MLRVSEPFGVAVLMRGDSSVRYALLNPAGLCYVEFDQPMRLHYVEHLCAGNLQLAEMKPIPFHRDAARALVEDAQWELGEWRAGGHGARSDLIPFYRVAVDEPDTPPHPDCMRGQNTASVGLSKR
jgi:hypothetical protein